MIIYHINRLIFALLNSMLQVGPDETVLARIDAKPHPSAVDEVISLLLSDTIEQKLILSDESSCVADNTSSIDSSSVGNNNDGWNAKRRKINVDDDDDGDDGFMRWQASEISGCI